MWRMDRREPGWKPGHREVATAIVKAIKDGSSEQGGGSGRGRSVQVLNSSIGFPPREHRVDEGQ